MRNVELQMESVSLDFGQGAGVFDLSFSLSPGTILGIIGPSGCGKTTTVRLLTGIYQPSSGEVRVFGKKPAEFSPIEKARIGYIPQHFILYPYLSAEENLHFLGGMYGLSRTVRNDRISKLLDFVDLKDARNRLGRNLSGGMKRRLMLAGALLHDPDLILADEPSAGIDPILRARFWHNFRQLRNEGRTLIVTTQYVGEAAFCDCVAVMRKGRLVTIDSPEGLRRQAMGGEVLHFQVENQRLNQVCNFLHTLSQVKRVELVDGEKDGLYIYVENAGEMLPHLLVILREELGIIPRTAKPYLPPFDEVFVRLIQNEEELSGRAPLVGANKVPPDERLSSPGWSIQLSQNATLSTNGKSPTFSQEIQKALGRGRLMWVRSFQRFNGELRKLQAWQNGIRLEVWKTKIREFAWRERVGAFSNQIHEFNWHRVKEAPRATLSDIRSNLIAQTAKSDPEEMVWLFLLRAEVFWSGLTSRLSKIHLQELAADLLSQIKTIQQGWATRIRSTPFQERLKAINSRFQEFIRNWLKGIHRGALHRVRLDISKWAAESWIRIQTSIGQMNGIFRVHSDTNHDNHPGSKGLHPGSHFPSRLIPMTGEKNGDGDLHRKSRSGIWTTIRRRRTVKRGIRRARGSMQEKQHANTPHRKADLSRAREKKKEIR